MAISATTIKGFEQIFEKIPIEKQMIAVSLIEEIKFMNSTLKKLKKMIKTTGVVEDFEQGKQKFVRESPAIKVYNATIKQRNETYTKLLSLLPRERATAKEPEDEFENFVEGRDD